MSDITVRQARLADLDAVAPLFDLFVAPETRGSGTGRALVQAAQDFATAAGSARMALTTARDNTRAQALYASSAWERDEVFLGYNWAPPAE